MLQCLNLLNSVVYYVGFAKSLLCHCQHHVAALPLLHLYTKQSAPNDTWPSMDVEAKETLHSLHGDSSLSDTVGHRTECTLHAHACRGNDVSPKNDRLHLS